MISIEELVSRVDCVEQLLLDVAAVLFERYVVVIHERGLLAATNHRPRPGEENASVRFLARLLRDADLGHGSTRTQAQVKAASSNARKTAFRSVPNVRLVGEPTEPFAVDLDQTLRVRKLLVECYSVPPAEILVPRVRVEHTAIACLLRAWRYANYCESRSRRERVPDRRSGNWRATNEPSRPDYNLALSEIALLEAAVAGTLSVDGYLAEHYLDGFRDAADSCSKLLAWREIRLWTSDRPAAPTPLPAVPTHPSRGAGASKKPRRAPRKQRRKRPGKPADRD